MTLALVAASCSSKDEPTIGTRGFIGGAVADEPRAARVALDMLTAGGTAADAAVALYFMLTVTLPSTASIGGGGVCIVYDGTQNRSEALDFTSHAPAAGGLISMPAAVRGMYALHARHGRLRWEQVLAAAEAAARLGHPVSRAFAADLLVAAPLLQADPEMRRIFLRSDGTTYAEGQPLVQRDLSTTLNAIRTRGAGELYSGPLARQFIDAARAQGARIEADDFRVAPNVWRPTVPVPYENMRVDFSPPPAAAGLLEAQIWRMTAERWRRATVDERPHLLAQASLRAWVDRTRWLASDLGAAVPVPEIVSEQRLNGLMSSYRADQRTPATTMRVPRNEPVVDDAAATGFVTVDRLGNAISCTVSSNGLFGAGRVASGTGIVLGRVPDNAGHGPQWLGPMMVTRNSAGFFTSGVGVSGQSQFVFAGAASGGAASSSALIGVALRSVVEKRPLEEAIDAQRIHLDGAPADAVFVETSVQARPPGLVERGYSLIPVPVIGRVNGVFCSGGIKDDPGSCQFRADRRGFGLAASIQ